MHWHKPLLPCASMGQCGQGRKRVDSLVTGVHAPCSPRWIVPFFPHQTSLGWLLTSFLSLRLSSHPNLRLLNKLSPRVGLLRALPASEQLRCCFQPGQGLFLRSGHVLGVRDVQGGPHRHVEGTGAGGQAPGWGWVQAASSSTSISL